MKRSMYGHMTKLCILVFWDIISGNNSVSQCWFKS